MRVNPTTVSPERTCSDALQLMLEKDVDTLPVVTEEGALAGIVTKKDLLYALPSSAALLRVWAPTSAVYAFKMNKHSLTGQPGKKILICDDESRTRHALKALLLAREMSRDAASSPAIQVVGEAQDGAEAISLIDAHRPEVIEIRRILGQPTYLVETGSGDRKLVGDHQVRRIEYSR